VWPLVAPAYPDTARLLAQEPAFRRSLQSDSFAGVCLNAGCGEGLYIPFLQSFTGITRFEHIDVNDPSHLASAYPAPKHRFSQGSLTELPFADATFDCGICSEVIEHIDDHGRAVSELARVMKPGGRLLVSVPQTPAPWDPAHVRQGYTFDEMRDLLETHGLRVVDRQDCMHDLTRWIMRYWRQPLLRFGADRTPYLPRALVQVLGRLDGRLAFGLPWDLVVLAQRT
jgi:SAM-dependent methyltransferase